MSSDPYPPVVNVTPPPQDPKKTDELFRSLSTRKQWTIYGSEKHTPPIIPPGPPRPTEEAGGEDSDPPPNPLPVAEISLSEMQEYVVEEEDMTCWKCKKEKGRKLPENGAILCAICEQILKP